MTSSVLLDIDHRGVATVTLNRPEKHNAFDDETIAALHHHFLTLASNKQVRVVILAASGKNFSAGADLAYMQRMANYSQDQNEQDAMQLANMLNSLYSLPQPTIARVQGAAYGGAVGLIACCDIAIGCELSKYCLSEVKLGLIPATISPYVIEALGPRVAKRYFMTAEVMSARRARRLGLLSETQGESEIDECINTLIEQILGNGPEAVKQAKALVHRVAGEDIDALLLKDTSQAIASIRVSEEGQEGLSAFLEKRKAAWRGEA